MEIFDISVPIADGMIHYGGDPPVRVTRVRSMGAGETTNLTALDMGAHSGTHVDAPVHFIDGSSGVDKLPLEVLIGPVEVVDATQVKAVLDVTNLRSLELPPRRTERIIFKTRNSQLWNRKRFSRDFVRLDGAAATYMLERGVKLIGIDYLSVGDVEAHRTLLSAGVVCVEGLDLRGIAPGPYQLICLPLKIKDSDGAPARAILVRE